MTPTTEAGQGTIRCGVFHTVQEAERAVEALRAEGFRTDEISVLCSDEAKERHFERYEHEDPAGSHTPELAAKGGLAGAAVGGLITLGLTTAAGLSLVAFGPALLLGGAVAGGFIGAMQSRGQEGALADYYDQALTRGDLLVAVVDESPHRQERLARAEEVLRRAGAKPVPLDAER